MSLRVSLGQYYSANSRIHRLDARLKLAGCLIYMVSCFLISSVPSLVLACLFALVVLLASQVPFTTALSQIRPIAIFLVVTSVFNLFFVTGGDVLAQLGPLVIHAKGAQAAVLYTARFILLLLMGSLLLLTTPTTIIVKAATSLFSPLERLGIPVAKAALVLSIGLRFVPTLAQDTDNILSAQTARGAALEGKGAWGYTRACAPVAVPLFASALRHADNLGRAMDARCYTGEAHRTSYHKMQLVPQRDLPAGAVLALYLVLMIILRLV